MSNGLYRFLTQDGGKPRTYGLVVDRRDQPIRQAAVILDGLGEFANDHPGVCAFGKIAVLAAEGIFTFQASHDEERAPVFCGNSTAAAIACLGGGDQNRAELHGMAAQPYEVSFGWNGNAIVQTWVLPRPEIIDLCWRGMPTAIVRALNDYAIVLGDLPEGLEPEEARFELLGHGVAGKLAVVSDTGQLGTSGALPRVAFYNSNGRHGAAPQTGLASLALAARSVRWLSERLAGNAVTYITEDEPRHAALPTIVEDADRLSLRMPGVEVVLSPLLREMAA